MSGWVDPRFFQKKRRPEWAPAKAFEWFESVLLFNDPHQIVDVEYLHIGQEPAESLRIDVTNAMDDDYFLACLVDQSGEPRDVAAAFESEEVGPFGVLFYAEDFLPPGSNKRAANIGHSVAGNFDGNADEIGLYEAARPT